jgi:hypothetical protein
VSEAPDTVTEAVAELQAKGYTADFARDGTHAVCGGCGRRERLGAGVIEALYRFEGPSDPADEAIVLGVRCPSCGRRGVVVSAFGPSADPDLFDDLGPLSREWRPS